MSSNGIDVNPLNAISKVYLEQIAEKKDDSYLETDMKKRQANNEKARKEMEKIPGQKNPHFEETEIAENRAAARAAGGYKDDSKKQPDPSKAGFTGIGNMSIDQIRKMSARIEKEKTKKEEVEIEEGLKPYPAEKVARKREAVKKKEDIHIARGEYDQADKQYKRGVSLAMKTKMKREELEASGLFSEKEIAAIEEAMSSYDRNRKRAAERAAARNAARDAGKTGVVPGVGYVSPRRERETYVDSAGTTRHKSGAKMPKD